MYENVDDDDIFSGWWERKQACLKEQVKVKRTNIMSAVQKAYKGEKELEEVKCEDNRTYVNLTVSAQLGFKSSYEEDTREPS